MANPARPRRAPLAPHAPPPAAGRKRWALITALLTALLALAWIDGGEEPLRPITEPVALPGQGR